MTVQKGIIRLLRGKVKGEKGGRRIWILGLEGGVRVMGRGAVVERGRKSGFLFVRFVRTRTQHPLRLHGLLRAVPIKPNSRFLVVVVEDF